MGADRGGDPAVSARSAVDPHEIPPEVVQAVLDNLLTRLELARRKGAASEHTVRGMGAPLRPPSSPEQAKRGAVLLATRRGLHSPTAGAATPYAQRPTS